MKNIFEGAKFGDKFVTEYNQLAIYVNKNIVNNYHGLLLNPGGTIYVDDFGKSAPFGLTGYATHEINIVGRYKEPIDDVKLNKFAQQYFDSDTFDVKTCLLPEVYLNQQDTVKEIFKAGYRKAMEE